MARSTATQTEQKTGWLGRGWASSSGFLLGLGALAVASLVGLLVFYAAERYVTESPRFRFRLARMAGDEDNLRIRGANRSAADEIRRVFRADQGRSLYTLPIDERRAQILSVKWVRDAAVIRRWPDGIDVVVGERQPAAFAHLQRHRSDPPKLMLVDDAGELLPIPDKHDYRLPVLIGLSQQQTLDARADRVRLMHYFLKEIADSGVRVADLDVADTSNLKCRVSLDGRTVVLLMGADGFAANMKRFVGHWQEIQERMPQAQVLDMRVAEHITAAQAEEDAGETRGSGVRGKN
jgi:cell division septal protein FtsQ